jgi:hypothetical protein
VSPNKNFFFVNFSYTKCNAAPDDGGEAESASTMAFFKSFTAFSGEEKPMKIIARQ